MKLEELKFLQGKRSHIRSKVTKLCNTIAIELENLTIQECKEYLLDLSDLKAKLEQHDLSISKGLWIHVKEESKLEQEYEKCEEYDTNINKYRRILDNKPV